MLHLGMSRCSRSGAPQGVPRDRAPYAGMHRMAAKWVNVEVIGSYFESLTDPRHTRNRKHQLIDIAVIAVCGMVCGCDGPTAIHRWAVNSRGWLGGLLTLPNSLYLA